MDQKLKHRTGRKTKHKPKTGFKLSLTSLLFIIPGIILLLIGLYYLLLSVGYFGGSTDMLMNTSEPTDAFSSAKIVTGQGLPVLLLYFLPAVLALILSALYAGKFGSRAYIAALLAAVYLVIVQIIISFFNFNFGECFYPTFFIASLFLFIPTIILLGSAFLLRKPVILILSCIYFYISVLLYSLVNSGPFALLFPFVLLFSILIYWVSKKIKCPHVNLLNFTFAIGFFGLFWLRKFVVNAKIEYLPDFFIFGILFYLLFYLITLLASSNKERPLRRWMQVVLSWGNLLFFLGTTSFVLIKYYSFGYLWVLVSGLLLINIAGIYLLKKYKSTAWVLPQYFGVLFLAALLLPVLFQQGRVLLFTAVFSAGMLVYAIEFKNRAAILIAFASLAAMLAYYLFSWVFNYLPAFLPAPALPETALLWHGLLSGLLVSGTLYFTKWFLEKDMVVPLPKKWFSKTRYTRLVRTLMLISVFFTMGWSGFALGCRVTGVLVYSASGWFTTGSIFFIGMITYYSGIQSIFKKPVLYFGFAFAFLYPLLVQWGMYVYLKNLVTHGEFSAAPLVLHYLALALLVLTGFMVLPRIALRNPKNPLFRRAVQGVSIVFLVLVLCTEYDLLSVLIAAYGPGADIASGSGEQLLEANRYLPYSLVAWVLALVVFICAVMRQDVFMRNFALALSAAILLKVFAFDFATLSQGTRSAVFIGLGVMLIGLAVVYPKLGKKEGNG